MFFKSNAGGLAAVCACRVTAQQAAARKRKTDLNIRESTPELLGCPMLECYRIGSLVRLLHNTVRMNRSRLFKPLLTIALLCTFAVPGRAASDWQVVKINGWDYLTVDNIAKFYGFVSDCAPENKHIHLDNGRNSLEVTLDSREAIVNGVRNWLCFPIVEREGKYLVSRIDLAKTIEPQFRPHMIKNLGRIKTVVIDPGHGGVEKGAASSFGNEKDFTLDVALKLRPLLQAKGFNVVMTRDKDSSCRCMIARASPTPRATASSSAFISTPPTTIRARPASRSTRSRRAARPSTQDISMEERFANIQVGSPVDAQSIALSTSVYHAMLGYMPEFDRGVKRARFAVLRLTGIPAILVEGGFLTERDESREIALPSWRAKLAQAIAAGIDSYRNLVDKHERPMLLADYRRQIDGVLVARNAPAPNESSLPPVFAVSNQLFPSAQFTQPLHHEPSEPIECAGRNGGDCRRAHPRAAARAVCDRSGSRATCRCDARTGRECG